MDNNEFQKAFGAGLVAALLLNAVLGAVGWTYFNTAQGKQNLQNWLNVDSDTSGPVIDSAGEASDIVNVVADASPAVVSIVITKDVPVMERYIENFQNPFGGSFGIPQYRQNGTEEQEIGGGSGFFISNDGYIVTNAHVVVDPEAKYTAFLSDGTKLEAEVVAADDVLDIAVLKVDGDDHPYLEFGDSANVRPGQSVIAIGNALGEFSNSVSVGVVSGLARSIVAYSGRGESEDLVNIIQTDAAINSGNSGGPLLDLAGKVIGVNVAASLGSAENIGFALPANSVKDAVQSIKDNGRVIRPYLGVRYLNVNSQVVDEENLDIDHGAVIIAGGNEDEPAVVPDSPAADAGLKEGDVITEINGQEIGQDLPLNLALRQFQVGDTIKLKVFRDGEELTVEVTLEEAP